MMDFTGTAIIVTGGAQGIGRATVEHLLKRDAFVIIADSDREAGEELAEHLNAPERLGFIETDVGDEKDVIACVDLAVKTFGSLGGLINNAGISNPRQGPVTLLDLKDWETMLRTNLTGSFLMVKHAAPHLARQNGAVVNIASTRALQSEPNTEAYAASKGGLVSLTHALAISFSGSIRVNAILPGWIDVSSLKKKSQRYDSQLSKEDHRQHPAGRVGVGEDIAALAAYLLSGEAAFITGQSFVVDGGMTKKMIYVE